MRLCQTCAGDTLLKFGKCRYGVEAIHGGEHERQPAFMTLMHITQGDPR